MQCTRCKQPIDGVQQPYHRTRRGPHHAVCPPQPTEAQIEQTCTEMLALDGWRPLKTNPCSDRSRAKGFGEEGMADVLYIRPLNNADPNVPVPDTSRRMYDPVCQVMWIEWKKKTGRAARHQLDWHRAERAKGIFTAIAGRDFPASIEGFWAFYNERRLNHRGITL